MGLEKLVEHQRLLQFFVRTTKSSTRNIHYEFTKVTGDIYSLKLSSNFYEGIDVDENKFNNVKNNFSQSLLYSIGELFSDKLIYDLFKENDENSYFVSLDHNKKILPVAWTVSHQEFVHVTCASVVHDYLDKNLSTIISNLDSMLRRVLGYESKLRTPVSKISAIDLFRENITYIESDRQQEYESLDDYIVKGKNRIHKGDIIHGVELKDRHKKSKNGTFTLFGDKTPVTVIVEGTSKGETVNVHIAEKVSDTMYKAVVYKSV